MLGKKNTKKHSHLCPVRLQLTWHWQATIAQAVTPMDKKEVEEELPDVFTFNMALAQSSTYYRWRHIGVAQQLANDEGIACFLMDQ